MKRDLTHAEAAEAFMAFARSIGSACDLMVHLSRRVTDSVLSAQIYTKGIARNGGATLYAKGDSYRELLAACEAKWAEHSDLHGSNVIREMALAIISITADLGECTDAALRAKFDAADVARYGDRACEQATEMASNGPFSIVKLAGANDAQVAA
jgi:hypothetical protein